MTAIDGRHGHKIVHMMMNVHLRNARVLQPCTNAYTYRIEYTEPSQKYRNIITDIT